MPSYKPAKKLAGEMTSIGTDTMEAVMKLWIEGFTRIYPKVSIKQEAKGSMTAEPALTEGRSQLAPLSRELMPDELARFKKKYGYEPLVVKVALGSYGTPTKTVALTFYVHESNPIKQLTFAQLDAIYCTERKRGHKEDITTWGQLGATGEWANRSIKPVGVMQPDGISNYIRLRICNDGVLKPGIKEEKIDHSDAAISVLTRIVLDVSHDPLAIGYAGFHNRQSGSKPVALAETDRGPFLMGTFDEVASARFPLTRFIYILVNQSPGKPLEPKVKEFLKYVLSDEGQQAVAKEGIFLPLPAQVVKQERTRLN
jgi:phosphate transport system substrate-binding protein